MPSLREIRRKIKSVKSTQQITKAMKMVAAARLRRAQARIIGARPFADKMEGLVGDLVRRLSQEQEALAEENRSAVHPLFVPRVGEKRVLLLVTSDKGLCGAFNTNLIRQTLAYLRKYGMGNVRLYIVGRKGRDYFRRMHAEIANEYVNIFNDLHFSHAEIISRDLMAAYLSEEGRDSRENTPGSPQNAITAVDLLYNEFKSVIQQRVVVKQLLPLAAPAAKEDTSDDFIYEPAKERFLEVLLPRFIKAQVFRALLESAAAELGARMSAMENATRNASELMDALTLHLNRTRQASITKEILEVVSGAEALK